MTSYSLYGTNSIRFVDGGLSTDDELAAEQLDQITNCVAAGAMRALLDSVRDLADPDVEVYAEQWHSAAEGWELDALHPDSREEFTKYVQRFTRENLAEILSLAHYLAWESERNNTGERSNWFHDTGMGIYRVGQLLGYDASGTGIALDDYDQSVPLDGDDYEGRLRLADGGSPVFRNRRRYRRTPGGRMALWVAEAETSAAHVWEGAWVDSTEEPCLLHLS